MRTPERNEVGTTRMPGNMIEIVNKVVRMARRLLLETGREPTPEELAERLAMPLDKVHRGLEIAKRPIRLDVTAAT